jgi:hypothetical protein
MEPASEIRYQRLTRLFAGLKLSSLWLGPDHLLRVNSNGYAETYKRFYFRDIQLIIVQETKRRVIWNAILAVPLLICLVGLVICLTSREQNGAAFITWLILFGIIFFFLLINNLMGTGCICYLRTAVQIESLPSLCRVPKTRRVLDKIRPLIIEAQGGELSHDAVLAAIQESAALAAKMAPASTTTNAVDNPPANP